MTTPQTTIFDLPAEINSLIFLSLNLRLAWYKKRPYLDFLLDKYVFQLGLYFGSDTFDIFMNYFRGKTSPAPLPKAIRLMLVKLMTKDRRYKEAFDEYFSMIDPNVVMTFVQRLPSEAKKEDPYFGAYHMAKDYLNSPELLKRLQAINPHNYEMITTQYTKLQKYYDTNTCTLKDTDILVNQYSYFCYSRHRGSGTYVQCCFSCAKTCPL